MSLQPTATPQGAGGAEGRPAAAELSEDSRALAGGEGTGMALQRSEVQAPSLNNRVTLGKFLQIAEPQFSL